MVVRIHLPILLFPRSQSEPGGSRCSAVGRRPCPFDRASLDRTRFGLETLMVRLAAAAGAVLRFQPSVCRVRFFVAVLVLLGEWPSLVTASALGAEDREFESLLPDNILEGVVPLWPERGLTPFSKKGSEEVTFRNNRVSLIQLVEGQTFNLEVLGSSPRGRTTAVLLQQCPSGRRGASATRAAMPTTVRIRPVAQGSSGAIG